MTIDLGMVLAIASEAMCSRLTVFCNVLACYAMFAVLNYKVRIVQLVLQLL